MKTLKGHILNHLTKSASHHVAMGNHHADLAEHHAALAEEHDGEAGELHKKVANCHKKLAAGHADRAEHFTSLLEALEGEEFEPKASSGERDFRAAAPTAVKANNPGNDPNVTLVPRFGGPDANAGDLSKVPQEHKHLIRTA